MANPITSATISAGGNTSTSIPTPGTEMQLVAVLVPSGWTSNGLVLQGSFDGANFFPMFSSASGAYVAYTATQAAAGVIICTRFDDFMGVNWIRFVSGTISNGTITTGNQTNAVTLACQFRTLQ